MMYAPSGQYIMRRLILTEGSPTVFPANSHVVHSEVVLDDDDDEVLLLWLAVPVVSTVDTTSPTSNSDKVIYSNTVIYKEDDEDLEYKDFMSEVNNAVGENLKDYITGEDDEYYS